LIGQLTQMKTAIEVIHKTALRELEAEAGHLGPDVIAQAAAGNAVLNTV